MSIISYNTFPMAPYDQYRAPDHLSAFADEARCIIEQIDLIYTTNRLGVYIPSQVGERLDIYPQYAEQIRLLVEITSNQLRTTNPTDIPAVYTVLDTIIKEVASGRSQEHARLFYRMLAETECMRRAAPELDSTIQITEDRFGERMQTLMSTWAADKSA